MPCETGRMAMQYRPFGSVIRPVFPTVCGTVGWARRCNCRQPFPRPNARRWGLMPLASLWRWHKGRNTAPVRLCGHRHLFIIYRQLPTTACIHLPLSCIQPCPAIARSGFACGANRHGRQYTEGASACFSINYKTPRRHGAGFHTVLAEGPGQNRGAPISILAAAR